MGSISSTTKKKSYLDNIVAKNSNPLQSMDAPDFKFGEESSQMKSNAVENDKGCDECKGKTAQRAEDQNADVAEKGGRCKGTKRVGNIQRKGVVEHILIMQNYLSTVAPEAEIEYSVPESSANGNTGFVDIANPATGEMYEIHYIKGARSAQSEMTRYVSNARKHCGGDVNWHPGSTFPTKILPHTETGKEIVVTQSGHGVVSYFVRNATGDRARTNGEVSPETDHDVIRDQLSEFLAGLEEGDVSNMDGICESFINQYPELAAGIGKMGAMALYKMISAELGRLGIEINDLINLIWTLYRLALKYGVV